ncbi:MAG: collagen-like protein [Flavobacteriales bacterium]|nr:collagen-like protein [Flavobacteriales bacterium]
MNTFTRYFASTIVIGISFLFLNDAFAQNDNVGIGTTSPQPDAILDISSTDKGMLVPRVSTLQRLGIANPPGSFLAPDAQGLLVYDFNIQQFCYWNPDVLPVGDWVCFGEGGIGGNVGPTGPQGNPGPPGAPGANGNDGTDGATGPAGADGATGTGPAGADGATGPAGADGATGSAGADGATGSAGADGATGSAGADGATGPAGADGATGSAGADGAQGPTGPAGSSNFSAASLSSTATIAAASFTNVAGMNFSFVSTGTEAFLSFSASGYGYTNSMSFVQFNIQSNNATVVQTNNKIQNYDDVTGTITPWSCSASRLMTGLTIGTSYTINVQGLVGGIDGVYDAIVDPSLPGHHMSVTILQ